MNSKPQGSFRGQSRYACDWLLQISASVWEIPLNARTLTMREAEAQSIRSNSGVKAVCLLLSVLFIGRESSHLTVKRGRKERIAVYGIFIWHVCTGCNAR